MLTVPTPSPQRGRRYPRIVLSVDEVRRLVRACSRRTTTGRRAAALLMLGWSTGLRISEALALRLEDVDQERGLVQVLNGKGGKRRTVPIGDDAVAVLERWLDHRRSLGVGARAPIFCTRTGTAMDPSAIRRMLPKLAARAGIAKRIHFHALRHTMASELAHAPGVSLVDVQQQLGHASLNSTQHYLDHVTPDRLIEVMQLRLAHRDAT
jgi:site-specific recombinase XerD